MSPEIIRDGRRVLLIDRLSDLSEEHRLHAWCGGCGRVRRLDLASLRAKYGDLTFEELAGRLLCSTCGHRGARLQHAHSGRPGC